MITEKQLGFDLATAEAPTAMPTIENPGPEPIDQTTLTEREDGVWFCTDWRGEQPRRFKNKSAAHHYRDRQRLDCADAWNIWRVASIAPRLRPIIPMVDRHNSWFLTTFGTNEAAVMYAAGQELGEICEIEPLDGTDDPRFVVAFRSDTGSEYGDLWPDALRWLVYDVMQAAVAVYDADWPDTHPDALECVTVAELEGFDLGELGIGEKGEWTGDED